MLAQMVVQTNAHPYHVQVISLWFSVVPAILVIGLILFVSYWQYRRNHRKSRHSVR
jgi:heme/copper-type cytochrome/quinol oxidase subunit 2